MPEKNIVLDLIVANNIEDAHNGPYVNRFSYAFMFDFLSKKDNEKLFEDGIADSYGIIKKRRELSGGKQISYFSIPFVIEGQGFASMTAPMFEGNYSDEELLKILPGPIRGINDRIKAACQKGMVLATEKPEAEVVDKTFKELGYEVNVFNRIGNK